MKEKKKWYIREEQFVTRYWEYEIEAETEREAKTLIKEGYGLPYNYSVDDSDGHIPIEIVEVKEITNAENK